MDELAQTRPIAPSPTAGFDLAACQRDDEIYLISPPQQFEGGEDAYDATIGGAQYADLLRCGQGAWTLATRHAKREIATILEIGAGGGTCTIGLIAAAPNVSAWITDTSPQFLRIVRRKLAAAAIAAPNLQYATLAGEDLAKLNTASFDAIIIASALHHVWDWRASVREAARILRPGGVMVIQEPCREGNLMMAMALDIALSPLWPELDRLDPEDLRRLKLCRDSIYYLSTSSIYKVGEDKHSFLPNELAEGAQEAGFSSSIFYSNMHFQDIPGQPASVRRGKCSLIQYLDSFLENHHRISADGMQKLRTRLFPVFDGLDSIFREGDGAALLGCMVFCR